MLLQNAPNRLLLSPIGDEAQVRRRSVSARVAELAGTIEAAL